MIGHNILVASSHMPVVMQTDNLLDALVMVNPVIDLCVANDFDNFRTRAAQLLVGTAPRLLGRAPCGEPVAESSQAVELGGLDGAAQAFICAAPLLLIPRPGKLKLVELPVAVIRHFRRDLRASQMVLATAPLLLGWRPAELEVGQVFVAVPGYCNRCLHTASAFGMAAVCLLGGIPTGDPTIKVKIAVERGAALLERTAAVLLFRNGPARFPHGEAFVAIVQRTALLLCMAAPLLLWR